MIIKQILQRTNNKNKITFIEHELLLAHVLKKSREYILAHPEEKLTQLQIKNFLSSVALAQGDEVRIKKRANGLPLAYITGEKEFYGFKFKVNKNVLIPRPETEIMIDEAIKLLTIAPSPSQGEGRGEVVGKKAKQQNYIIDVGTGSGCIIISLAKIITNCEFIGIDISKDALAIAKQNARINKVDNKIKIVQGNLLEPILNNKKFVIRNSKFLIVANLPYLTPTQIKNSPSIKHEPKLALTAGADGLKYYRQLFKQIAVLKKLLCAMCYVLCEIEPSQKNSIKQLIKKELPEAKLEMKKDLKGHSRLVILNV
jgi:release factor glutamine methyltransferase